MRSIRPSSPPSWKARQGASWITKELWVCGTRWKAPESQSAGLESAPVAQLTGSSGAASIWYRRVLSSSRTTPILANIGLVLRQTTVSVLVCPASGELHGPSCVLAVGSAAGVEADGVGGPGGGGRATEAALDVIPRRGRRGERTGLGADRGSPPVGSAQAERVSTGHEEIRHPLGDGSAGPCRPGPGRRPRSGLSRERVPVGPVLEVARSRTIVRRALAAQGGAVLADVRRRLGRAVTTRRAARRKPRRPKARESPGTPFGRTL